MPVFRIAPIILLATFLLLPVPTVVAQEAEPALADNDQQQTTPPSRGGRPQFRADVDQVVVYAAVHDKEGQLVPGLSMEDFTVSENDVVQVINSFGQEDIPATIGLVLDKSGSMRIGNRMDQVIKATELFLSVTNPENELFVVSFNHEAELDEPFTRDPEDIRDAINNIIVSGGTALYDAIYLAVDEARKGSEQKKVVIVFTDGADKDSHYSLEQLLDKIQESDVQVHVVAFLDPDVSKDRGFFGVFKSEKQKLTDKMQQVADYTGGKALFPEKTSELEAAFQEIAQELKQQYRLAYISSNGTMDGSWRSIDVKVADAREKGLKVRAKRGYFAARN
jgi:Ca-activated chloride channel homolog